MRLTRRGFLIGMIGAGVAASPAAWYGAVHEPNDIEIVRRKVLIPKLASKLDGLRAVQISDLHLRGAGDLHSRMVREVKALDPHFIFFTGDLVDEQSAIGDAVDIFRSWQPPGGIWAVPGNWDHTATDDDVDIIGDRLKDAKVHFLRNTDAQVEDGLWISGVDDPSGWHDDLGDATRNIPAGAAKILLAHSPDVVHSLDEADRFGLILAGHTHGGQVNLPFFNGAWLKDGPAREYVEGLYEVHGSPMYVNRGIGTTTLPIRIGARPEITEFTFHA